ncbi:MAG: hypothetical protein Q9166_003747 [cf. Caloplaca sp. 2 TL-2023]
MLRGKKDFPGFRFYPKDPINDTDKGIMSSATSQSVNESPKPSPIPRKQAELANDAIDSNDPSADMDLSMDSERELEDEADNLLFLNDGLCSDYEPEEEEDALTDSDNDESKVGDTADDPVEEAVTTGVAEPNAAADTADPDD